MTWTFWRRCVRYNDKSDGKVLRMVVRKDKTAGYVNTMLLVATRARRVLRLDDQRMMEKPVHKADGPEQRQLQREADSELVKRILAGEEDAFNELIEQYYAPMIRLAKGFLTTQASAEEVVQDAWMGVLKGLARFEGRSSLKTWLFRILVNRCITRRKKDGRSLPFSSLGKDDDENQSTVDPSRFTGTGMWGDPPERWEKDTPEKLLLRKEAVGLVESELKNLPERQRIVVTLRDIDGWPSEDVCNVLEISASNQRVLLHRGRTKLRAALEEYLDNQRQAS